MTLSRQSNVSKRNMPHPQDISTTVCGIYNRNPFQPETVQQRCKRRVNLGHLSYMIPATQSNVQNTGNGMPTAVAKRNERERKRVRMVNNGFTTLRQHVPSGAKNKKLSKVETLRSAIDYIKHLQQVLGIYDMPSPTDNSDIDLSLEEDEQTSLESSPSDSVQGRTSDGGDENVFPSITYTPSYGGSYSHANVPSSVDNQYNSPHVNMDMCHYQGNYSTVAIGNCSAPSLIGLESHCHNIVNYHQGDDLLNGVTTWFN